MVEIYEPRYISHLRLIFMFPPAVLGWLFVLYINLGEISVYILKLIIMYAIMHSTKLNSAI